MKTISFTLALWVLLLTNSPVTAQCPVNLTLSSQSAVDAFATDYPGCTEITGNLVISGANITSLEGLNGITHIGGYLQIMLAHDLTNVDGLSSLVSVGTFIDIYLNHALTDISGLGNVVFGPGFHSIILEANSNLSVCNVPNFCRYFANPSPSTYVTGNAAGCATIPQIRSACITPDANGILYVKKGATGNGTSWTDALGEVSEAFAEAQTDLSITQIWVAEGTYSATGTGLRMRNNLEIYGGFDPDNGIDDLSDKRISPSATTGSILTGDNVRRVVTNIFTPGSPLNDTAVLNGFTITKGNPPHTTAPNDTADSGGGIINQYASPKLVNLFVFDNYANDRGGGIYNGYSSAAVVNTVVTRNSSQFSGGGIYNFLAPVEIINCTIAHNHSGRVGGVRNLGLESQVVMTNSIVSGNTKTENDPENVNLSNLGGATITYHHTFVQNLTTADAQGNIDGALDPLFVNVPANNFRLLSCSPMLNAGTNTAFAPGATPDLSAFTTDLDGDPRMYNGGIVDLGAYENEDTVITTLYVDGTATGSNDGTSWANAYTSFAEAVVTAHKCMDVTQINVAEGTYYPEYSAAFSTTSAYPRNRSFTFRRGGLELLGGYPSGGGTRNTTLHPTILSGNIGDPAVATDNAFHVMITYGSVVDQTFKFDGFTITNGNVNSSTTSTVVGGGSVQNDEGGGWNNTLGSPAVSNVIISGNSGFIGTGFYNELGNPSLTNIVISGNNGDYGSGIYNRDGNAVLTNCTITGNRAILEGGGIRIYGGSPVIANCIIYGNTAPQNPEINIVVGSPVISYSIIQGLSSTANGNLDGLTTSPQFIAPTLAAAAPTTSGNYHLQANSPVINTGNSALLPATITTDLDGNERIIGLSTDMGAYEYQGAQCAYTTTWNGATWSNGLPDADTKIIFDGDYTSDEVNTDAGVLEGCSLEVISGIVVISEGHQLIIDNEVTISGYDFFLKNNASLVQIQDDALNKGTLTYERLTPPIYRYDYVYWASPVTEDSDFLLGRNPADIYQHGLSPGTLFDKFHAWDTDEQAWYNILYGNEAMVPGKGYIVRAPQSYGADPLNPASYNPFTANFIGKPNNGVVNTPIAGGVDQWNLIGNPYPSALYVDEFLYQNNTIVDGTVYIWTHSTAISNGGSGGVYNYDAGDYATYNLSGAVGTGIGDDAPNGGNVPSGYIPSGQSFFIKGSPTGGSALFNNSMRVIGQNDQFFRPAVQTSEQNTTIGRHRIWLNITGAQNAFRQMMVGYIENATDDLDWGYDGETFSTNSVSFYSVLDDNLLAIQGRALPFEATDEVPLGYKATLAGTYTISIAHVDGLLEEQDVYLEDTVLHIVHDLKASDYTFTTLAGTFNERFVLRYLATDLGYGELEGAVQKVIVAKINDELVVKSVLETLRDVSVYDILGRAILHKTDIGNNEIRLMGVVLNRQTLILKVTLKNGLVVIRKLIY